MENLSGAPVGERPWLAHYDPGVPPSIDYPAVPLPQLLAATAARYPERAAIRFYGATMTYGQLAALVDRFAAALHDLGVRRGDRVAIMLPNVPQFVIAFYATLRLGAVAVPTNPLYKEHELAYQLADAGAETLIVLDRFYATARRALPATAVRTVICTGVQDFLPRAKATLYPLKSRRDGVPLPRLRGARVRQMRELLRHAPGTEPTAATSDDLAVLQYTGGTTGVSKGAMLTHRNLVANAVQVWHWHPIDNPKGKAATLCVTPFFHVYGLTVGMNSSIYGGITMLLLPRFIVSDVIAVIRKYRPVSFPGVPTMYLALANYPGIKPTDCAAMQACISGAAPLPGEVQEAFERATGGHVVEGYGLTEASPVTHTNPLGRARLGAIGVPYPDTDAAIVDAAGGRLGPGGIGELVVRGPQVMLGYWNRPEETAQVIKDGWLHTGDIGTMDEEGYFAILDRAKDVIIAGGFNVYPREVEDVLFTHPAVHEAAVVGIHDAYRGETVKAVIVLKEHAHATEEEIIAYCRARLAAFKAPHLVEFRDSLPKSTVGKVLRRELTAPSDERSARAG